ncbi:MAG: hypothetical protein C0392_09865 [Syntrophus sp. (in: bacteria)]|nr:hypothetical protein [Syntrophus sp. (in: bacteria)]
MINRRLVYICLNLISVVILLGGLGSAILIYQTAENDSNSALGYEKGYESMYPVMPQDSKKHLRNLELYGGKANVLMTQLRLWLVGLWQGKSLAFMVAFFAILLSFGVFYAANHLPYPLKPDVSSKNNRYGTD